MIFSYGINYFIVRNNLGLIYNVINNFIISTVLPFFIILIRNFTYLSKDLINEKNSYAIVHI